MINIDGIEYRVHIIKPSRTLEFEITEGENSGLSLSTREIRDILGTKYGYTMKAEPMREFPEDFDALFLALSAPVESHRVIMPFGQGEIAFEAAVRSGKITDHGLEGEVRRWREMEVRIEAIEPQRKPGETWPPTV